MLVLALYLLCGAATIGAILAIRYLKGSAKPAIPIVPAVHAILGAASLTALIFALSRGLRHTGMGTAGFGPTAAVLLSLALALGVLLARASWRRKRPGELLVGAHAGLGIAGLVLLLTLVALS
jgi:hypothetical protein